MLQVDVMVVLSHSFVGERYLTNGRALEGIGPSLLVRLRIQLAYKDLRRFDQQVKRFAVVRQQLPGG